MSDQHDRPIRLDQETRDLLVECRDSLMKVRQDIGLRAYDKRYPVNIVPDMGTAFILFALIAVACALGSFAGTWLYVKYLFS